MGYQLIYNSSFKDIDENTINIEIYKDSGGTLIASELLCSADAVSINYESDDDVFKPIKCSDCQINVLTTKVLANLYTALGNQIYCTISKNGSLLWCGYSVPCLYSTDYNEEYNLSQLYTLMYQTKYLILYYQLQGKIKPTYLRNRSVLK